MYDYEPSNETLSNYFSTNSSISNTSQDIAACDNNSDDNESESQQILNEITYRLDGSMDQELFFNYWKNRLSKFDLNLIDNSNYYGNTQQDNLDKDTLNKTSHTESGSASTPGGGTFRFVSKIYKL